MSKEEIYEQLKEYWVIIDNKRDLGRYTMGECSIIAKKSKALVEGFQEDEVTQEAIAHFDKAMELANQYGKTGKKEDTDCIMDVLLQAKWGLDTMLE